MSVDIRFTINYQPTDKANELMKNIVSSINDEYHFEFSEKYHYFFTDDRGLPVDVGNVMCDRLSEEGIQWIAIDEDDTCGHHFNCYYGVCDIQWYDGNEVHKATPEQLEKLNKFGTKHHYNFDELNHNLDWFEGWTETKFDKYVEYDGMTFTLFKWNERLAYSSLIDDVYVIKDNEEYEECKNMFDSDFIIYCLKKQIDEQHKVLDRIPSDIIFKYKYRQPDNTSKTDDDCLPF